MKILFISHDTSHSGAPKSLRLFINWIANNRSDIKCDILLRRGVKLPFLDDTINTYLYTPPYLERSGSIINRIAFHSKILLLTKWIHKLLLLCKLKKNNYDLIYSNTIVNADVLDFLSSIKCKKIVHAREVDLTYNDFGGEQIISLNNQHADKFIAITNAVSNALVRYGVDKTKISVVNNHIELKTTNIKSKYLLRRKYNIPKEAFLIGGCGNLGNIKGFDVFLQLAAKFRETKEFYFIWYGMPNKIKKTEIEYDVIRLNLTDKFIVDSFLPNQSIEYFSILDCFFFSSKSDGFGLVGLEASLNKVPIICFEKAGGQPEFVSQGAGYVVPYMDIDAVYKKINLLYDNKGLLKSIGEKGYNIVREKYDIEKVAPKLLNTALND
ncbi:Glycosyltransferase involved in cell wall bisynthesis [Saccharicrinis carchari]|uniref:Glycosyltransferase involved in cell wall bisynthesis n=1 Tax=Saccharicrinis carchari TaxID=1168039 RepID=A0A521AKQ4_SACCC|nr:glycosyltransferase family 4 protein [Saccharicrinis carchari]SMO35363.1 Glycosyltransferase involved in cell wall bisynthesis [Saccharicrinis carchari]